MNQEQVVFLSQNRHLIPDPDVVLDLGVDAIFCRDLGTDINGEHFGPYTLDKFCHLRVYKGLAATTPSEYHVHRHIFDVVRVGDTVRFTIKAKGDNYNPIDGDWWTVIYRQEYPEDCDPKEGSNKILLESMQGAWVIVYRNYYTEIPQLMTADI